MKWNDKLKTMRAGATKREKQSMPVMTTDNNCQNSQEKGILSVNGSSQFGHSSKYGFDYTSGDLETILQERIAIMMFDGGLSEAEAVRLAGRIAIPRIPRNDV